MWVVTREWTTGSSDSAYYYGSYSIMENGLLDGREVVAIPTSPLGPQLCPNKPLIHAYKRRT